MQVERPHASCRAPSPRGKSPCRGLVSLPLLLVVLRSAIVTFALIGCTASNVGATCMSYIDNLPQALSADVRTHCQCYQPEASKYVLLCNDLRSLPCPTEDGISNPASSELPNLGLVVKVELKFNGNLIAEPNDICLAAFAGRVNGDSETLSVDFSLNHIASLPANVFRSVKDFIRELNLSGNQLRSLTSYTGTSLSGSRSAFAGLQLQLLDLSSNSIGSPCGVLFRQVDVLLLQRNSITSLSADCFMSGHGGVRSLDLSHNAIVFIHETAFRGLHGLANLSLARNRLSLISSGYSEESGDESVSWLRHVPALQRLDLSGNSLGHMGPLCRSPVLSTLNYLDLRRNSIKSIEPYCFKNSFGRVSNGDRVSSSKTVGPAGHMHEMWAALRPIDASRQLELRLDENNMRTIGDYAFHGLGERLVALGLAANHISSIALTGLSSLEQLQVLDLSDNALVDLSWLCNVGAPGLVGLSVRRNSLTSLLSDERDRSACSSELHLLALRWLDLSGNRLVELPASALSMLSAPKLENLDLSNNRLVALRVGSLAGLPALRRLRLSGNALLRIAPCSLVGSLTWPLSLPSLTSMVPRLVELHYDDNPLQCGSDNESDACGGGNDPRWLLQLGEAVISRSKDDLYIDEPIRTATCSYPLARRGLSIAQLSLAAADAQHDSISSADSVGSSCGNDLLYLRPDRETCAPLPISTTVVNGSLVVTCPYRADSNDSNAYVDVVCTGTGSTLARHAKISENGSAVIAFAGADVASTADKHQRRKCSVYEVCVTVVYTGDVWQRDCAVFLPSHFRDTDWGDESSVAAPGVGLQPLVPARWPSEADQEEQSPWVAFETQSVSGNVLNGETAAAIVMAILLAIVLVGSVLTVWLLRRKRHRTLQQCKPLSELRNARGRASSRSPPSIDGAAVTEMLPLPGKPCPAADGSSECTLQNGGGSGVGGISNSSNSSSSTLPIALGKECGFIHDWTPMRRVVLEDYV